jgi:hypothetical protein
LEKSATPREDVVQSIGSSRSFRSVFTPFVMIRRWSGRARRHDELVDYHDLHSRLHCDWLHGYRLDDDVVYGT